MKKPILIYSFTISAIVALPVSIVLQIYTFSQSNQKIQAQLHGVASLNLSLLAFTDQKVGEESVINKSTRRTAMPKQQIAKDAFLFKNRNKKELSYLDIAKHSFEDDFLL